MSTPCRGAHPDETVTYLSDAWLDAADAAVADLAPLPVELRVGYSVLAAPPEAAIGGDHTLVLGPDRVSVTAGLDRPTVTLTMTWELAVRIAQGATSAQRAFLDGLITLEGRPDALLGHQGQLAAIDDLLVEVRARTTY